MLDVSPFNPNTHRILNSETYIEVKDLKKRFGKIQAVNGLGFSVFKGDIFGFLGPNGAGKSTTIRILLSLVKPDSGTVSIFSQPLEKNRTAILSRIGAMVEEPRFYEYLSAYKNLEMLGKLSGKNVSHSQIMQALALTGIEERHDSPVKTFSQGMKQRLGIAQAIVHDPDLLILDEPANGLDPRGLRDIREVILRLNREFGKTILISSHILKEIEQIAGRMIIINKGTSVVEGNVHELLNASEFILRIEVSAVAKAFELISEAFKQLEPAIDPDDRIIMRVSRKDIPLINKLMAEHDIDVFSLTPVNSLEQYFLDKT